MIAIALVACVATQTPRLTAEAPKWAGNFVESIGVNTHLAQPNSPYAQRYSEVRKLLLSSGIRHVRDTWNERMDDLAAVQILTCVYAGPEADTPTTVRDKIAAANKKRSTIDAIEGPYLPDLNWPTTGTTYRGEGAKGGIDGIIRGTTLWMVDLYKLLTLDPQTIKIPIIGPTLGIAPTAKKPSPFSRDALEKYVDYGAFRPYPFAGNPFAKPLAYGGLTKFLNQGNFPSVNLDESPDALTAGRYAYGLRLMVATETGYPTSPDQTSEAVQAKYIPRLVAEYFRLGLRRTYLNELVDSTPDQFGLVRSDLTPKPAYNALASLINLLADPGKEPSRTPMNFWLEHKPYFGWEQTKRIHHLLLQKQDGTKWFLIWHEVSSEDASVKPHKPMVVPPMPTILHLDRAYPLTLYRYDEQKKLVPGERKNADSIGFDVFDEVAVVKIEKPLGAK